MAKDTVKGIGKETLSEDILSEETPKQETVEDIIEETEQETQEQENGVQTEEENKQQENQEIVKYRTGYKMLITDFGNFSADENGDFLLTKEQYNKLMKK